MGVTRNIGERVSAHIAGQASSFTRKYGVKQLVYFETFDRAADAIAREKVLKRWRRAWKINLIEQSNPEWRVLNAS